MWEVIVRGIQLPMDRNSNNLGGQECKANAGT